MAADDAGLALLCSRFLLRGVHWYDGGLLQAALAAGPGSAQQMQLFGLLCSLLKSNSQLQAVQAGRLTDAVLGAALAAASILQDAADRVLKKQQPPALLAAVVGSSGSVRSLRTTARWQAQPVWSQQLIRLVRRIPQQLATRTLCCHGWCCLAAAAASGPNSCCKVPLGSIPRAQTVLTCSGCLTRPSWRSSLSECGP